MQQINLKLLNLIPMCDKSYADERSQEFFSFVSFCYCASHSIRNSSQFVVSGGKTECDSVNVDDILRRDMDYLIKYENLIAVPSTKKKLCNGKKCLIIFSSSKDHTIHPGYARLYDSEKGTFWRRSCVMPTSDIVDSCGGPARRLKFSYIDHLQPSKAEDFQNIMEYLHNLYVAEKGSPNVPMMDANQTAEELSRDPGHSTQRAKNNAFTNFAYRAIHNNDYVPYISSPVWPTEATEWITRPRLHNSPPSSLIKKCVRDGCGFVAAAHKNTSEELADIEFRFSFSLAEKRLICSWQPKLKATYARLKYHLSASQANFASGKHVIHSYHLKTLMLWSAEKKPPAFWSTKPLGAIIAELLCELIECIVERRLLHYFIPTNNLFECLNEDYDTLVRCAEGLFYAAESTGDEVHSLPSNLDERKSSVPSLTMPAHMWIAIISSFADDKLRSRAMMFELNNLFCSISCQRDCVKAGIYSPSTVFTQFLAATSLHQGYDGVQFSSFNDILNGFASAIPFRQFDSRLSPAKWYRAVTGTKQPLEDLQSCINGPNSSAVCPDLTTVSASIRSSSDFSASCSITKQLSKMAEKFFACSEHSINRHSLFLAMAYHANYHYVVIQDYRKAIEICNDAASISNCDECRLFITDRWCVPLAADWSVIFDDGIQKYLGLVLLHEAVRLEVEKQRMAKKKRRYAAHYSDIYVPVPVMIFLKYIRASCKLQLILQDISDLSVSDSDLKGLVKSVFEIVESSAERADECWIEEPSKCLLGTIIDRQMAKILSELTNEFWRIVK